MFTNILMGEQDYIASGEWQNLKNFSNDASSGTAWSNPSNAQYSDNAYSTVSFAVNNSSKYLTATGLIKKVPSGATINGISMRYERHEDSGTSANALIFLTKDGINFVGLAKNESGTIPTSDAYAEFGGPTDKWGTTWSEAEVNADTFGSMTAWSRTFTGAFTGYIDNIQIAVHYSL